MRIPAAIAVFVSLTISSAAHGQDERREEKREDERKRGRGGP
jgi:hypothetical protein